MNLKKPTNARINDLQGIATIQNDDLSGAPSAPTGLTANAISVSQINLNWSDNSSNETGFRIERKTASTAYTEIATTAANAQSYSNVSVSSGATYTYRVRAYNAIANSGYSNEASATTPCEVNAAFTANVTSGCAPLNVSFTDQSAGPLASWSWNFGNGATSTAQHPTQVFNTPGTYTITLIVASAVCNDVETKTSYITVTGPPTAAFTATPLSGNTPLTVNFTNQSTPQSGATSWLWNFGNGATSTAQHPSYQYTAPGTYTVTLTATNACGSDGETKTNYITVSNTPVNIALNKPATASSTSGSNTPSKAVDGSASTYWRSGSISSSTITSLRVDLQTAQTISRVVIKWNGSYYAKNYQIQISNDGTNWSTVYTDNAGTGGTDDYTFSPTTGRYVRVYMTKNNKSSERINEFEVYGNTGALASFNNTFTDLAPAPEGFALLQSYPNPFNPQTKIRFSLEEKTHVALRVLNNLGQEVALLLDEPRAAGMHEVMFDAHALPSGVYFAVLQVQNERRVQRLLLMK